jgi:hypothetical protein
MAPNIYCCGAGTAADTEAVTGIFNNAYILVHISISFLWLDFRFHLVHIVKPLKLRFLFIADMVSSQLQLHRYHTGRESRVVTALTLLKRHLFKLSFRTSVLSDLLRVLTTDSDYLKYVQLPRSCLSCISSWWSWHHWTAFTHC